MRGFRGVLVLFFLGLSIFTFVSAAWFLRTIPFFGYLLRNPLPGDFQISASPTDFTIPAGGNATTAVTVKNVENFKDFINLGSVANWPGSYGNGFRVTFSPSALSLPGGATGMSIATIHALGYATPGNYTVKLHGVTDDGDKNTLFRDVALHINLIGFAIKANPSQVNFLTTASGHSNITVSSVNGYSGQVQVSASTILQYSGPGGETRMYDVVGPSYDFDKYTLVVNKGQTVNTILRITSASQGDFQVTVSASDLTRAQSTKFNATAFPTTPSSADFNITLTPSQLTLADRGQVEVKVTSINSCFCIVNLTLEQQSVSGSLWVRIEPAIITILPNKSSTTTLNVRIESCYALDYNNIITVSGTSANLSHSATLSLLARC